MYAAKIRIFESRNFFVKYGIHKVLKRKFAVYYFEAKIWKMSIRSYLVKMKSV